LTFLKYYTNIQDGGEKILYITVRGYALPEDILLKKMLIKKAREGAEKSFGENGIMAVPAGAVHIIPDFSVPVDIESIFYEKPKIVISLLKKEERAPDLLEAVKKEFETAMGNRFEVVINSEPEELFVTI